MRAIRLMLSKMTKKSRPFAKTPLASSTVLPFGGAMSSASLRSTTSRSTGKERRGTSYLQFRDEMLCRLRGSLVVVLAAPTLRQVEGRRGCILVRDRTQNMGDAVEARAALIIALHGPPASLLDVGVTEHLVLGLGVLDPFGHRFEVHGAQFPSPRRVARPLLEASLLFLVADRKPVLQQRNA